MTFQIINALLSAAIFVWLGYNLVWHTERFSTLGRVGAAVTGAGVLLGGAALADSHSPFEGWASVVFRLGVVMVLFDWLHFLDIVVKTRLHKRH